MKLAIIIAGLLAGCATVEPPPLTEPRSKVCRVFKPYHGSITAITPPAARIWARGQAERGRVYCGWVRAD